MEIKELKNLNLNMLDDIEFTDIDSSIVLDVINKLSASLIDVDEDNYYSYNRYLAEVSSIITGLCIYSNLEINDLSVMEAYDILNSFCEIEGYENNTVMQVLKMRNNRLSLRIDNFYKIVLNHVHNVVKEKNSNEKRRAELNKVFIDCITGITIVLQEKIKTLDVPDIINSVKNIIEMIPQPKPRGRKKKDGVN